MAGIGIRPSQFILTYGVGSILEASSGPRMIPEFDKWGEIFYSGSEKNVSDFEIDVDIHENILDGNIFRIPTNVSLNKKENHAIFKTFPFPSWGLCVEHGYLFEFENNERTRCPDCRRTRFDLKRKQAIRFVRACPDGHMDDIDWRHMISHKTDCGRRVYRWTSTGGSLDDVIIRCGCNRQVTLQDVYDKNRICSGRFPEIPGSKEKCENKNVQIALRGSSMLRIPKLLPIIAIPGPDSPIHRVLQKNSIITILASEKDLKKEVLVEKLKNMCEAGVGRIKQEDINVISETDNETVEASILDVLNKRMHSPSTIEERRLFEFRTLKNAATNGHPVNQSVDAYFSVPKRRIRSTDNGNPIPLGSKKIRVVPIEKLRVITIQKGYQRLGTANPDNHGVRHPVIERFYLYNDERWYPGMEQIGEGIFIDDDDEDLSIKSDEWNQQFERMGKQLVYHPVFVWWHSLSHRIISAVSLNSGYSSTAIREVVYIEHDNKSGKVRGGILFYTSQPGGDGSLGGLVSKTPKFEKVIERAVTDLEFCSNDPLCFEQSVTETGDFGASCYACLHLSETSCTYFNRFLDRKILLDNM